MRSSTTTANRRVAVTILTLLAFVQHGVAFNSRLTRWRVRRRSAPPRKSTSDFRLRPKQQPPVLDPSATADAADAADAAAATFAASADASDENYAPWTGDAAAKKKLGPVDVKRLGTYLMATALETAGICALLFGADAALAFIPAAGLRTTLAWLLFAFLSLRSRVFSVLDNSRPNREAQGGAATPKEVKRPAWTPPGYFFPIIWLTITCLRATAATMAYGAGGTLCSAPHLALALHLAVGDVWNTITNMERRLGVSAATCPLVLGSVLLATRLFFTSAAGPAAGLVLAPSCVWISVACVLTLSIWRLNGPPRMPFLPRVGEGLNAPVRLRNLLQLQPTTIGGSNL